MNRALRARAVGAARADSGRVSFHDQHPTPADLRDEVLAGLSAPQKRLSPKFFYDQRGSRLFDAITGLPEYYPTRTEIAILTHLCHPQPHLPFASMP